MSSEALTRAERAEIKTPERQSMAPQETEIAQVHKLKAARGGAAKAGQR